MKKEMLIKFDDFVIEEMKQELEFTEECLYEAVKKYKKDKNMPALIITLKQIIKARDKT